MRWLDGITRLNRQEFEQSPGDGEGQGSLARWSPWGRKESDTTERPKNRLPGQQYTDLGEQAQL